MVSTCYQPPGLPLLLDFCVKTRGRDNLSFSTGFSCISVDSIFYMEEIL